MKTSKLFVSFSNVSSVPLTSDKRYSLNSNDIIIYNIYLPNFIHLKPYLYKFLNSLEIKKAQRFYKETDRDHFIIYRSILKLILGAYTKLHLKNIYLDYD